jgi:hypothetical protein
MSKFKDWLISREAKRQLGGRITFFEWLKDKYICFEAKREIKKQAKEMMKSE